MDTVKEPAERQTTSDALLLQTLQRLPSTVDLEAAVVQLQDEVTLWKKRQWELGVLEDMMVTKHVQQRLDRAQKLLKRARTRDDIQATRPENCWCLGSGGRGQAYVMVDGEPIDGFAEYCTCPESQDARQRIAKGYERREQVHIEGLVQRLFGAAQIPGRFEGCTLNTYPVSAQTKQAHQAIAAWIREPKDGQREGLFLYGPVGTGKTGMAIGVLKEWVTTHKRAALFVPVPDLLARIKKGYDRESTATKDDIVDMVKDIPLLVLDDMGAERVTEWVSETLFTIVNYRHDRMLPTIVTSNLGIDDLVKHIGPRIVWRLVEMCQVQAVNGPNLRDR